MSHDATAWAKAQITGSSSAKFILLLLADYAGTDYSCYPSVRKLAEVAEMGESTVRAATKLLAEKGLIRVFYRHKTSGLRRSCRYQLLVDGPETMEPDADDWGSHRQISAVDAPDLSGSARQISADIPVKEPSLKNEPPVVTPAAARMRATRVPDDFMPSEEMKRWFIESGYASLFSGPNEHEKFMDYWRSVPGIRGQKVNWVATWRNWMRTAADRSGRQPGNALVPTSGAPAQYKPSTTDQRIAQGQALAAKYREQGL